MLSLVGLSHDPAAESLLRKTWEIWDSRLFLQKEPTSVLQVHFSLPAAATFSSPPKVAFWLQKALPGREGRSNKKKNNLGETIKEDCGWDLVILHIYFACVLVALRKESTVNYKTAFCIWVQNVLMMSGAYLEGSLGDSVASCGFPDSPSLDIVLAWGDRKGVGLVWKFCTSQQLELSPFLFG